MFRLGFVIFLLGTMFVIAILGGRPLDYLDPATMLLILLPLAAVLTATGSFKVFVAGWRAAHSPKEPISEELRGQAASLFRFLSKITMLAASLGMLISLINILYNLDFSQHGSIRWLPINIAASLLGLVYGLFLVAAFFEPVVFILKRRQAKGRE